MLPRNSDQTHLNADVPPFVPRKDYQYDQHVQEQGGGASLPRYLTTCYPFVQEQQDRRWPMQQVGSFFIPQAGYSGGAANSIAPVPVSGHNPVIMGMIPPNLGSFAGHMDDVGRLLHGESLHNQGLNCSQSVPAHVKTRNSDKSGARKVSQRNVGIQKEVAMRSPEARRGSPIMVDSSQQTDFPLSIAFKSLTDRPSPLKKVNRTRRRRTTVFPEEDHDSSSDHADVDSDSGYYSPKHRIVHRRSGGTSTVELTSGFPNLQRANETQTAIPPVVYLATHPLYQVHQADAGRVIPAVLPPHATPPPPALPASFSASPVFLTPPSTPLIGHPPGSPGATGYPIRHFGKPPNPLQVPGSYVWHPQPRFSQAYRPRHPSSHQHRPRPGASPGHSASGSRSHSGQAWQVAISPGDEHHSDNMDNMCSPDRRKNGGGPSVDAGGRRNRPATLAQTGATFLLSDTQDFPGLGSTAASGGGSAARSSMLSYTDVVLGKALTKPAPVQQQHSKPASSPGSNAMQEKTQAQKNRKRLKKVERASKAADEEYAEISKEQENIKKALRKTTFNKNRSKTSVLDLGEIVSKLEAKANADKSVADVAPFSSPPKAPGAPATGNGQRPNPLSPANPLDATAPSVKRGKEKETPRPKKPSALKKVILKEREEKKEFRVRQLTTYDVPDTDIPPYPPAVLDTLMSQSSDTAGAAEMDPSLLSAISSSMPQIHSRKYREYCSQVLDKKIDETCTLILQKLVQFQDRLYQKDPLKAKMKRRLVMGIREVTKHLKLKKLKCVIVSPNLEKIQSKGGLDDALQQILTLCEEQNVTYVFALGRKAMGRAVSKLVPVSIVGIFDYSGVEDLYKQMCEMVVDAQNKYKEMVSIYQQEVMDSSSSKTPPIVNATSSSKRFAHMGHSRNPSAASCISFASFISEPISELNEGSNWRVMMDANDEQSTLSPPMEAETSSEDEADASSGPGPRGGANRQPICRKDSDSTVVEAKPADDDVALERGETGGLGSSGPGPMDPKNLDKSFSTTSTLVPAAKSPRVSLAREDAPAPVIEGLEPEGKDRIQMWLEDASRSVQQMDLDDVDSDDASVSSCDELEEEEPISPEDDDLSEENEVQNEVREAKDEDDDDEVEPDLGESGDKLEENDDQNEKEQSGD